MKVKILIGNGKNTIKDKNSIGTTIFIVSIFNL